jgi:outer membrane protein assembly factor BamB
LVTVFIACHSLFAQASNPQYWAQWRGPNANGVAPAGNPPIEWSDSTNIQWKIPIPGKGIATPIIWGDQIFIQTAVKKDQVVETKSEEEGADQDSWISRHVMKPKAIYQFIILSISRKTGDVLWQKILREELPHEGMHKTASFANNSPVTDGKHVIAYFGSRGIYCLDIKGNILWEKDLGNMNKRASFGEGSSPALYNDKIVVNWDHEGDSFIVVLDKKTGQEIWRKSRDEKTSWSTPLVIEQDGNPQIIMSGTTNIIGYDLTTGNVLWQSIGMTENVIPSPVYADGKVVVMSGYRGSALQVIQISKAKGDVAETGAILWTHDRNTPYVPSPLLYDDLLFFLEARKENLSCLNAMTGEVYYESQALDEIKGIYASIVGASGRVYIVGKNGVAYVIKKNPVFQVLAKNTLDDAFDASPVIVDKELYLRGHKYLYCISEE